MKLFRWLMPKAQTLQNPEFARQTGLTSPTGTDIVVDPDASMRISTVYACVRIIGETIASLPLHVYQRKNGGRVRVDEHPLADLLGVSPNDEQTSMEMREFVMTSLGLRGNAYCSLRRGGRGEVRQIDNLKPQHMRVERDASRRLTFTYNEPNNEGVFSGRDIWRVAALSSDGVTGLSPISLARETLGLSLALDRSANRMFSNGSQTSMTLEFDHQLTDEQIENLREQFADNYAGWRNAHKPLILESGMKANAIGMSNADAQFLENRKAQVVEIAKWYRVPPHMLGDLDRATFSNIEHQSIEFVTHTIRPWLVRLEQSMNRDLLTDTERRRGLYSQHTVEGLLRGDTKSRYESYASAIVNGWMSRNEVRNLENLNQQEGLDEFMVPLNMAPAGQADEPEDSQATSRIADAENAALMIEAKNKTSEEFAAWAVDYYGRAASRIEADLGVDASGYMQARVSRMADARTPLEAAHEAAKHTLEDIEALT